jgi:4,5-DOPA dioxygenase extradiol
MTNLPSLFLSHGAPNLILHDSPTRRFLGALGASLPRPSAVLIMSAHFETAAPAFETGERPGMIYDFGGFERELYEMTYPAPGAPALAERAAELAHLQGFAPVLSNGRGYDHGTWVPLKLRWDAPWPACATRAC